VQIEQHQHREPSSARPTSGRHFRPADDHIAAFPTRLALARWTRGGDIPHVYSSTHNMPARGAWFARAQRDFQAWLEQGGFHGE